MFAMLFLLQTSSVSPDVPDAQARLAQSLRGAEAATCPADGLAVQVLGSGGPVAEASRAATSYLIRVDSVPRLLVDAGSGSFLRFAESGARVATLDAILLTHLHGDHAGDLVDVLNSGGFEQRDRPLTIVGPDAAARFPAIDHFLTQLIGIGDGAFAYLGGYGDGSEGKAMLDPQVVTTAQGTAPPARFSFGDLTVTARPVHHGPVPSLGYEIGWQGRRLVITGDQSMASDGFAEGLRGSNPHLLLAHHVIPMGDGQPRGLHRDPQSLGELAAGVGAGRMVLTHNMNRSLARLDEGLAAIRTSYDGPVHVAFDLDCFPV